MILCTVGSKKLRSDWIREKKHLKFHMDIFHCDEPVKNMSLFRLGR